MGFEWYQIILAVLIASAGWYAVVVAFPSVQREPGGGAGASVHWSPIQEMRAAELVGEPAPLPETKAERRMAECELSCEMDGIEERLSAGLGQVVWAAINTLSGPGTVELPTTVGEVSG